MYEKREKRIRLVSNDECYSLKSKRRLLLPNVIFMNFFKRVDDALRFKAKCKLRRMEEKEKKEEKEKDSGCHPRVEIEIELRHIIRMGGKEKKGRRILAPIP